MVSKSGLEATVRELLQSEPMNQISEKRDTWGRTVLCAAILGGKEAVVRAILRHGADVNVMACEQSGMSHFQNPRCKTTAIYNS